MLMTALVRRAGCYASVTPPPLALLATAKSTTAEQRRALGTHLRQV